MWGHWPPELWPVDSGRPAPTQAPPQGLMVNGGPQRVRPCALPTAHLTAGERLRCPLGPCLLTPPATGLLPSRQSLSPTPSPPNSSPVVRPFSHCPPVWAPASCSSLSPGCQHTCEAPPRDPLGEQWQGRWVQEIQSRPLWAPAACVSSFPSPLDGHDCPATTPPLDTEDRGVMSEESVWPSPGLDAPAPWDNTAWDQRYVGLGQGLTLVGESLGTAGQHALSLPWLSGACFHLGILVEQGLLTASPCSTSPSSGGTAPGPHGHSNQNLLEMQKESMNTNAQGGRSPSSSHDSPACAPTA